MPKTVQQRVGEYRQRLRSDGMTEITLVVPSKDRAFFRHLATQSRQPIRARTTEPDAPKAERTRLTAAQLRLAEMWAVRSGLRLKISRSGMSMSELLALNITHELVERGWPAGHSLGTSAQLQAHYQVGPRVLHEAMRLLLARSVAVKERGPQGRLIVRHPSLESASYVPGVYIQTEQVSDENLRATCLGLTLLVAERCLERMDAAAREEIKRCILFDSTLTGASPGTDLQHFQRVLATLTGDPLLVLFNDIVARAMRFRSLSHGAAPLDREQAVQQLRQHHADLARALLRGDLASVREAVLRHHGKSVA